MKPQAAELNALYESLRRGEVPAQADALLGRLSSMMAQRGSEIPTYRPSQAYDEGVSILYAGEVVEVVAIRRHWNPRQGSFAVIDLRMPDGETRRVLSEAPLVATETDLDMTAESADSVLSPDQQETLRAALATDGRFARIFAPDFRSDHDPAARHRRSRSPLYRGLFAEHLVTRADKGSSDLDYRSISPTQYELIAELVGAAQTNGAVWDSRQTWQQVILPLLRLLGWAAMEPSLGACYGLIPEAPTGQLGMRGAVRSIEAPLVLVRPVRWLDELGACDVASSQGCPVIDLVGRLVTGSVSWGVLTNGRHWRIYRSSRQDSDVGSTATEFYEMDLVGLLGLRESAPDRGAGSSFGSAQPQAIGRWTALFGADAFVATGFVEPKAEQLKRDTAAYARRVVQHLRTQLLESVVPEIAGGFIAYRHEHLGLSVADILSDEGAQREILKASLGLVARLLFVLHAESQSVFPVENPDYRGQSLWTMQRWATSRVDGDHPLERSTRTTPRYDALIELFHRLEHGAPQMALPSHSDGLFSSLDPVHRFLDRHRLSDRVVARTLAALGRIRSSEARDVEALDYTALSVRHLSAVFEGLMDSTLWIVEASAGQVALVGDGGTPLSLSGDPVPDYVGGSSIERAIGQILEDRAHLFTKAMDRVVELRRQETGTAAEVSLAVGLQAAERTALDSLLNIKVLDPAARGGGLLVSALDTLTDGLIGILGQYHASRPHVPWGWDPVYRRLCAERANLQREIAAQGLSRSQVRIDIPSVLSRTIAETCLYGVDRSSLAVSLTRTCLQIRGFTLGTTSLRLGHHIRCGDSLRGLRIAEVGQEIPSLASLEANLVTALRALLAEPGDVEEEVEALVAPYRMLLTLWLSEDYGNRGARHLLRRLGPELLPALRHDVSLASTDAEIVRRARKAAEAEGFLHWELAFPEVLLVRETSPMGERSDVALTSGDPAVHERSGFDIVMGRPPSGSELGAAARSSRGDHYALLFASERRGPFTELAHQLVRKPSGRVAFVIRPSEKAN